MTVALFGPETGGDATGDTIVNVENITGSSHGDILYGTNDMTNVMNGGDGADFLYGLSGEDTLIVTRIGGEPREQTFPHVDSLRVLIEAFADAVEGRAPFPVTPEQMLDVIGAFEGAIASLATGSR